MVQHLKKMLENIWFSYWNGINPELIVVRADIEGYSPVSQGFGTYYNYWGIGCYNNQPLSKCISYDTFDDGVLGFINNVSSYDSLSSMMKSIHILEIIGIILEILVLVDVISILILRNICQHLELMKLNHIVQKEILVVVMNV